MSVRDQLNSIAKERILILDGAMGSMIQTFNLCENDFKNGEFSKHPLPLKGCNDLLCVTRPEVISSIHDDYLKAGADIIETCSFNSNSVSLSDYGLGDFAYKLSFAAAEVARKSADKFSSVDKPRFVAGSIGPTAKGASLYPDINDPSKRSIYWDELESAYYDNARGLLDGGADIFIIETIFDTLNAKAALFAVNRLLRERNVDVPVIISATISGESDYSGADRGRLLSGQTPEAFYVSVLHAKPLAIGFNCSFGAEKMLPYIRLLSEKAPCLVSAYPNAGLPNRYGRYEVTPDIMAANIEEYFKEGLINIIGGCCGSTPDHIAAIANKAVFYKPRKIPSAPRCYALSGLESLYIEDKLNLNVKNNTERQKFLDLLNEGEYEDAVDTMYEMVDKGVEIINIETDDEKAISKFLDFALMNPYVAKAPFMIFSSRMNVLESGLKRVQGRSIAGPINLKDGEAEFLRKAELIHCFGAVAAVTLVDEQGQAVTDEHKIRIIQRIYQLLKKSGHTVEGEIIILSPTDDISIYSWIRNNYPGVITASYFVP